MGLASMEGEEEMEFVSAKIIELVVGEGLGCRFGHWFFVMSCIPV